ncbi:hypothetical protein [Nocardia sp. N2S4-5]|uniref:hypothetical protein n=1 Tax=Nocardia sp. N2S4-5 TaxID=3351565 RepID=UPI0037CD7BC2
MPIAFETGGLQQLDPSTWGNPATGDLVTLVYVDAVPDLPAPLEDIDALRRKLTEQQAEFGCLIEAYTIAVAGQPALLRLEKFPLGDGAGLGFTAGIVVPKATCSAILKIMCRETGRSGTREAAIVPKVGFQNMFRPHPYAPEVRGKLPYNVADDAQWDSQFPDHPLSRARRWISLASRTARIDPRFAALPPFTGPAAPDEFAELSALAEEASSPAASSVEASSAQASSPPALSAQAPSGHAPSAPVPSAPAPMSPAAATAAETAPIPSASALGKAPRKPAAPAPTTPTPGSIPRLPASAAAYAAAPSAAAKTTAIPASVDFSQPPATDISGSTANGWATPENGAQPSSSNGNTSDAAETTAMPAGIPLGSLRTSDNPAETTVLSTGPEPDDAHGSPNPENPWHIPESSAESKLPADKTTAIPTRPARDPDASRTDAHQHFTSGADETTALPSTRTTAYDHDNPASPETVSAGAETRPIPKS